jgi:demethylmenaquinone methyltransferase/2-methoxy-6-polyprenyl-1,4-benzoquinol methylase
MTDEASLLDSQLRYYGGLAAEFDETILPHFDPAMPAMLTRMRAGNIKGDLLELASGTGYWTRHLAELAEHVTCLDGSPEMIAALRQRGLANIEIRQQDLFAWTPERQWDCVFFAHWLAHVPETRFEAFWAAVARAVRPGGVVEFVDATEYRRRLEQLDDDAPGIAVRRTLLDGRSFRVVKVFRNPDELTERLGRLGWESEIDEVYPGFLYATCRQARH